VSELRNEFMYARDLTDEERPAMSNWLNVAKVLAKEPTVDHVAAMLRFEVEHANRKHVIDRLFSRWARLFTAEQRRIFYARIRESD
jgi:hypothetical protein